MWTVFARRSPSAVVGQHACPFLSWSAGATSQSNIMVVQSAALDVPSTITVAQNATSQTLSDVRIE